MEQVTATLSVHGLSVGTEAATGGPRLVEGVAFDVLPGRVAGIVGETGAGKSLTVRALLGLLPPGLAADGAMTLGDGRTLSLATGDTRLREIRGSELAIILQSPQSMFDPLQRIGPQLTESVRVRRLMAPGAASERAVRLLGQLGFAEPAGVLRLFPHQLSGGMVQRAAIAMALMPSPRVVIADEPTSALDAHLRVGALTLLRRISREEGVAIVIISHDLGLVSHFCDSVMVMYAGRVVESGPTATVLRDPRHPYTAALLGCSVDLAGAGHRPIGTIPGAPPLLRRLPPGCAFAPRCRHAFERCREERPELRAEGDRAAACHLAFEP